MQADDATEGQTSLNLKCYKMLYHTIPWQRSWQFLLFFLVAEFKEGKKNVSIPKPFT